MVICSSMSSPVVSGKLAVCQFSKGIPGQPGPALIRDLSRSASYCQNESYLMDMVSHINPKRPPSRWVSPGGVKLTMKPKLGLPETI